MGQGGLCEQACVVCARMLNFPLLKSFDLSNGTLDGPL